jgi:hypothetical protein
LALLPFVIVLAWAHAAAAAPKHPSQGNFGSANEPTFTGATGLAVNQSTGDVLVIDSSAKTVSRWHADGTQRVAYRQPRATFILPHPLRQPLRTQRPVPDGHQIAPP